MRIRIVAAGIVIALLAAATASAAPPAPSKSEAADFADARIGQPLEPEADPLEHAQQDLALALAHHLSLDAAADSLAAKYALTPPVMRALAQTWVRAREANDFNADGRRRLAEVRERLLSLAATSDHAELVMRTAAKTLVLYGQCKAEDLDALATGARDRKTVVWNLAAWGDCPVWFEAFVKAYPDQSTAALIRMVDYGQLNANEEFALYQWLLSDATLAHVDAADRERLMARLNLKYVGFLFGHGLQKEALQRIDGLTPAARAAMFASGPAMVVRVDGLTLPIEAERSDAFDRLDLAAAYYLTGRVDEARALAPDDTETAAARAALRCALTTTWSPGREPACPRIDETRVARLLELDLLLRRPADDPYPLAETFFTGGMSPEDHGVWSDIACKVFADPQYADLCQSDHDEVVEIIRDPASSRDEGVTASERLIAAAALPGWSDRMHDATQQLDAVVARYGGAPSEGRIRRASIDPAPSPFKEAPIPQQYLGAAAASEPAWVKTLSPLPDGYEPVRVARDGQRVAVISLSQNYDPTGEVSGGGYWVHLSKDGGRTWSRPLYTGLSDLFPYRVLPDSRLPLFDGDALNVAVQVRELDTASITYPPVATKARRRADNLYLRIPIADLERDSDGSGLTDLAAEHLLLRPRPRGATPFIVGTASAGAACAKDAVETEVTRAVLEKVFSVHTGAIIEPIDRPANDTSGGELAALARGDPNSADRPIFIEGDPADFACIKPDRLMIVYSAADIARLGTHTPDFHAATLSKFVFNRARDRGFVRWSLGWTGGTYRFVRDGDGWRVETLGNWIT